MNTKSFLPCGGLFSFKLLERDSSSAPGRGGRLACLLSITAAGVLTKETDVH